MDVDTKDLVVVCRKHHDEIHALLKKYPKLKLLERRKLWKHLRLHLTKNTRIDLLRARRERRASDDFVQRFAKSKQALFSLGLICKLRMPFIERVLKQPCFMNVLDDPQLMLHEYIFITGRDPRRLIPDIIRAFPVVSRLE